MLRPEEAGFLAYLKQSRVPLQEFDFCWNKVANIQEQLEKLIGKNYFLNLSAKEAYKAYVRAYDSHSLKHIFDIHTLDLVAVARSFGFHAPPFVDLPISGRSSTSKRPSDGGRRYAPAAMSGRKTQKTLVFRSVPLQRKGDKRHFTR